MSNIILFFPKSEEHDTILLPASVLMVAAPLVKLGYVIKIIDQRVEKKWKEILLEEINKNPLIFGISALTGKQILNGLDASKLVKENSNVPIVWGGVHASLLPYQTLENKYVDYVIIGEGEETFLELINHLKTNSPLKEIKGLGYKQDNKIFINSCRDVVDLNTLWEIPYHLIDTEDYIGKKSFATGKPARNIAFYTSRGCPHRCGFCYNKEFNKQKWRGKSAEKVVEEMSKLVKDYRVNSFEIEDDEFFVDRERVKKICELIIDKGLDIEIFTTCRVNYVVNMDDNYLNLLYRAGFKALAFGVESGSERILELIHKDITINQVFDTIIKFKKAGINSKYYFMAGFPTETTEDLFKTTDLIQKMKQLDPQIRVPGWRIFTPYPGTDLYNLAVKQGWIPPKTLEEWATYNFNTVNTPWVKHKEEKIIKNAQFLIDYLEMGRSRGRGIFFNFAKIFGKIADWRWRHHLFLVMPEKYFILFILKMRAMLKFSE